MDLVADSSQNVSQVVELEEDLYTLSLNYHYPRVGADLKTFNIYFNGLNIFRHRPTVPYLYERLTF